MENQFDLKCPMCGESGAIDVAATVWVRLMEDGTDAGEAEDGDHEWDGRSAAKCCDCHHVGTVDEFDEDGAERASPTKKVELDVREISAILAGLRLIQRELPRAEYLPQGVHSIFDNDETLVPLSLEEIDALCERIN